MSKRQSGTNLAEYLTVKEAASFLGVSPWTLRNWDKAGRLRPLRHPKNGYRIYRHEELADVLKFHGTAGATDRLTPQVDWRAMAAGEHFVQFYESDAFLIDSAAGFVGSALVANEGVVVAATKDHLEGIERELMSRGLDVSAARSRGQYLSLDANEALAAFMVDGQIDRKRFMDVVGEAVMRVKRRRRNIRAFGEMVAILWKEGNRAAAIALEELWNELNEDRSFTLFCAYPMSGFDREDDAREFGEICSCHSRVVPAESYAGLAAPDERLRAISHLQQKARALEAEIEHRKQVEAELCEARAEAERAIREKDELLAAIGHDPRTRG